MAGSGGAPESGCPAPHGLEHGPRAGGQPALAGLDPETRFYFVHSYAVRTWEPDGTGGAGPLVTWGHHGEDFVAAVEDGPLWATQFHPEKSADAGAVLLRNWLRELR